MTDTEIIEVVSAHKEGKKIQFKTQLLDWQDCANNEPAWEFTAAEYRVAPEPRELCPTCGRRIADILAAGGTVEHYDTPEPRKPREFWLTTNPSYSPVQHEPFPNSIHVREILE